MPIATTSSCWPSMASWAASAWRCSTAHVLSGLGAYSDILRRHLIPSGFRTSDRFAIQLGALCAVAGLAIHSVFDFDMHIPGNAMIFAFLFGVMANPAMERPPAFVDRLIPWTKVLLPALGVFMLWRSLPLLPSEYCSEMARRALRSEDFMGAIQYARKGIGGTVGDFAPVARAMLVPETPEILDKFLSKTGGNPNNPDLYFYIGEANRVLAVRMLNPYMKRRYYGAAATAFAAGLKVFPQEESMLVRYGQSLDGMGRFSDAEGAYQEALKWDPKLDAIHQYYESHLAAEGKKAEAEALAKGRMMNKPVVVDADRKSDSPLQ